VRVGLEDAPARSDRSNVAWVEWAASQIAAVGTVATPAQVRRALASAGRTSDGAA
jgi:hypothetical protein